MLRRVASLDLRLNGRDHRHAGAKVDRRAVQRDFHGNTLHHLGEIAGGVVRRQQREFLAAGRCQAVDMSMHHLAGEHVDFDVDRLARMNVGQLRLLEIRDHIGAGRGYQRHQLRAGLDELTGAQGAISHHAVDRRHDGRVREIELGLPLQSGGPRGRRDGLRDLGLEQLVLL
jgi:hypothetical protein